MVETNQIQDPNYVLDEKGKAHYLFDKKGANGETTKEFRTHNKVHVPGEEKPVVVKAPKEPKPPKAPKVPKAPKAPKEPKPPKPAKVPKAPKEPKTSAAASRNKRKRRGYNSDDSSDISEFDCDDSGSYMAKWSTTKRTRTRAAAIAAESAANGGEGSSSPGMGSENGAEDEEYDDGDEVDPTNPLPGFIDPITLEVVEKPAISKYGHVMGYDSWLRCLLQDGATRNICPISKKPMTKRDLTVLTFENIDEYR
jgi:hypothetical protein